MVYGCGQDSIDSRSRPMVGSREYGNEPSDSMKRAEFIDLMKVC